MKKKKKNEWKQNTSQLFNYLSFYVTLFLVAQRMWYYNNIKVILLKLTKFAFIILLFHIQRVLR